MLWSLSTAAPVPVRTTQLVERAAIFALEPTATRMALGRLVREDMAKASARGAYVLGPAAAAIHAKARSWASVEDRVRAWTGAWIVVLTDHLGRTDRPRLQQRERALRLGGFARSRAGAWVRPDNLRRDIDGVTAELHGLGLDADAVVFGRCMAGAADDAPFRSLWPRETIESEYRHWIGELQNSARALATMPPGDAARETLLLGQAVIRAINSDPLLPAELIDTTLRADLIETMVRYDALGQRLWSQVGRPISDARALVDEAA